MLKIKLESYLQQSASYQANFTLSLDNWFVSLLSMLIFSFLSI
jgi:hypothetical protein